LQFVFQLPTSSAHLRRLGTKVMVFQL